MCHPAVYIGIAGLNVIQARQSYRAEKNLTEQAYRDRQEQIASNRSAVQLEAIQKANVTKNIFFEKQATNRALLSPSGIAQSNSFEAAMKENKSQMIQELNVNALAATRKQSELAYASIQSGLQKQADLVSARTRFTKSLMDSATTAAMAGEGLLKPSDTGGALQRTTVRKVGVPGDAGFGPSSNPLIGFRY